MVGDLGVDRGEELAELDGAVAPAQGGDHGAVADLEGSEQAGGAVPDVVLGAFLGHAGHHRERRLTVGQGLDLGLLVHAQHHRGLGRVQVEPDDVIDLSTNSGSLDSLKSSLRCGCSSKAFQIRPIVDLDSPQRSAIDARDQCVALAGVDSSVATTTSSTCSAVTNAGRPGRGSLTARRRKPLPPPRDVDSPNELHSDAGCFECQAHREAGQHLRLLASWLSL